MNSITVFEFDHVEVEVVVMDGEPWFNANQVAKALGYTNPSSALQDHVFPKYTQAIDLGRKGKKPLFINEAGIYQFGLRSSLPAAKKFQEWLLDEVLPATKSSKWQSFDFESASKQKDNTGFVYLAMSSQTSHCKIGMSKKPYKRMTSLQTGNPLEVVLIHRIFTLDMVALEKALHDYYQGYWMRGEWFDLPLECIKEFPIVANELDTELEKTCLPESKIVSSIN